MNDDQEKVWIPDDAQYGFHPYRESPPSFWVNIIKDGTEEKTVRFPPMWLCGPMETFTFDHEAKQVRASFKCAVYRWCKEIEGGGNYALATITNNASQAFAFITSHDPEFTDYDISFLPAGSSIQIQQPPNNIKPSIN